MSGLTKNHRVKLTTTLTTEQAEAVRQVLSSAREAAEEERRQTPNMAAFIDAARRIERQLC